MPWLSNEQTKPEIFGTLERTGATLRISSNLVPMPLGNTGRTGRSNLRMVKCDNELITSTAQAAKTTGG
jgi:hypothetical protein